MPDAPASPPPSALDTPWRRMAAAVFAAPTDARLSVTADLNVTEALAYVRERRPPGVRLGLIHLVAAAIARTIAEEVPQMNTYLWRGRVRPKRRLDVLLTAKVPGQDALTEVRLQDAHAHPARALAAAARTAVGRLRTPEGQRGLARTYTLARLPWVVRRPAFRLLRGVSAGLGISLPQLDLAPESFGAVVLSEVGRYKQGARAPAYWGRAVDGPLVPAAQGTSVAWLMEPREAPVVHGGAVTVRLVAPLSVTFDHRLVDGNHIGRFFAGTAARLQDPEALDATALDA